MSTGLLLYTLLHVLISLIGIGTGLVVVRDMLKGQYSQSMTAWFLITTVLTSVTGFGFPFERFLPSHAFGIVSLLILPLAILGLYVYRLKGAWNWLYVVSSITALYLNCFVLVVQLFLKIAPLRALAPTQTEPPFGIAQGAVFLLFVWLGVSATRRALKSPSVRLPA
jgi:hypothetical protein